MLGTIKGIHLRQFQHNCTREEIVKSAALLLNGHSYEADDSKQIFGKYADYSAPNWHPLLAVECAYSKSHQQLSNCRPKSVAYGLVHNKKQQRPLNRGIGIRISSKSYSGTEVNDEDHHRYVNCGRCIPSKQIGIRHDRLTPMLSGAAPQHYVHFIHGASARTHVRRHPVVQDRPDASPSASPRPPGRRISQSRRTEARPSLV